MNYRRNFVAKHMMELSGSGRHEAKRGKKHVKRSRQKEQFRNDVREAMCVGYND